MSAAAAVGAPSHDVHDTARPGIDALPGACQVDPAAHVEAWRTSQHALDVACRVTAAPAGALFACPPGGLWLLALRRLDQDALDEAHALWRDESTGLARGRPYGRPTPPLVALPCRDQGLTVALLVFSWPSETGVLATPTLLAPLGRMLAHLVRQLAPGLGLGLDAGRAQNLACASPDTAALHALLDEHEWNVARVARLLGVTRTTVYNRLRQSGLPARTLRRQHRARRRTPVQPAGVRRTA